MIATSKTVSTLVLPVTPENSSYALTQQLLPPLISTARDMQLSKVLFFAAATLAAAKVVTTLTHVLGRSPVFMLARQDDTTC